MGGDIVYTTRTDKPRGDIVYTRRQKPRVDTLYTRRQKPRVDIVYTRRQKPRVDTLYTRRQKPRVDIVYTRRRLASRTDKPCVNLHSQSPSQIQEPNSSTKMTDESKVNDQLHLNDYAKSAKKREHNDNSGMSNYASGKRHSLASVDLSAAAHLDIAFQGAIDTGVKAPAYSSSMEQTMNSPAVPWSDDELDSLWIGVRRHGCDNWDAILSDPVSRSLARKTPCELALKWEEEQLRLHQRRTTSQTPLPRMPLPNPNEGIFMSLIRHVEVESAMKARGTANS